MQQFIEDLYAFVNRQSRPVQWLMTAFMVVVMLDQCMAAGELVGKTLFRLLH